MRLIHGWLAFIGRIGLSDDLPLDKYRGLYATNIASVFHLLTTLPYVILFAIFGSWDLVAMSFALCLTYPAALWLMSRRFYSAARFCLLGAITTAIFIFCLLLGEPSRLETTLLYTVAAPVIFFSVREYRKIVLAILMPCLAYGLLHASAYGWIAPYPLTEGQLAFFRVAISGTTALLILLPVTLLLRAQLRTEQDLIGAKDKAEKSDKAKSEFLATVSHELRTPLNGLLGTLELLDSDPLTENQSENLAISLASGKLLRNVIADILDYSRFEKGLVTLESNSFDMVEVLRRTLATFQIPAEDKGLRISMEVMGTFPRVIGDDSRIQQIGVNLIGNALKFTDRGGITLRLTAQPALVGRLSIQMEVVDTGIGIPLEKQASLFEPFTQAHRGMRVDQGGCGLGLSICRRLTVLMNGRLTFSSQPGQGSTFCLEITLPVDPNSQPQDFKETPLPLDDTQRVFTGRVLLVEDVAVNRFVAAKFLQKLGFTVTTANNGQQGLEFYRQQEFDWVLMDCQMPVMDGFEATREIRKLAASGIGPRHPVIIALTANARHQDRIKCVEAGMDAFLEKPISLESLQSILRQRAVAPMTTPQGMT